MEDKDLPEIGFKKKKEKKGFLSWLRQRLGLGGPSSLGTVPEAGIVNIGRSLGTAKTAGLLGLLTGKVGGLITLGVIAAAIGTTMYLKNSPSPSEMAATSIGDTSKATATKYIPAIERVQQNVSSLDMFKQANKGLSLDEEKPKEQPKQEEKAVEEPKEEAPQPNIAGDMMAKLQGFNMPGLSSDLGGGGNRMQIGGFANKFGQGAFGPKVGFSNVGSGFGTPKLDFSKNKLFAMKNANKIPVKSQIAKKVGYGKKALSQAMGVKFVQRQGSGKTIESLAGQQNKAWEGQTGEGDAQTGVGAGEGQDPGIMTSPSIDNPAAGGGPDYNPTDIPDANNKTIDNPWGNMLSECMTYLIMAAILSFIGGKLVEAGQKTSGPWGAVLIALGIIVCLAALAMAVKVIVNAIQLMSTYGQTLLGIVYLIAGLSAVTAAILAMAGAGMNAKDAAGVLGAVQYFAGAAGILGLLASMAVAPNAEKNYMEDKQKEYEQCIKDGGSWDDSADNGKGKCVKG